MRSLQARLGAGLAASLATVLLLQWLVVTYAIREVAEQYVISRLEHDIDSLVAGLGFDAGGKALLEAGRLGSIYQHAFSGHYYRVVTDGDVLRSRSLWDRDLPEVRVAGGATDHRRLSGPRGQTLLLLTRGFTLAARPVTVSVAEDLTPLLSDLRGFNLRYALVSAAALLLLLAIQGTLLRLGLRPMRRVRAELEQIARGERQRLDEQAPEEILPLVRELNTLLAVLRDRLERSRHALGNLAHAIKTPLTLLADLAQDRQLRSRPALQQPLAMHTETIRRLVDRELKRARLAGSITSGQRFDVATELPALVETLRAIYRDKPLEVALETGPAGAWPYDREDMLELLGNLLDNACKWARSRIRLTVSANDRLRLTVEDDGPGCSADELARIAERGVRLDEAAPGHGLGLSIVRDILDAYGGTLELRRSEALGGLHVRVELPLAITSVAQ